MNINSTTVSSKAVYVVAIGIVLLVVVALVVGSGTADEVLTASWRRGG